MENKSAVQLLAALAQDSRLTIFRLLVQQGETGLPVSKISEALGGMAGATLSFHLKELSHAGLIEAQQQGRFIFYKANLSQMKNLMDFLTDNCCQGQPCAVTANKFCGL